jgi:hypothetical protein
MYHLKSSLVYFGISYILDKVYVTSAQRFLTVGHSDTSDMASATKGF